MCRVIRSRDGVVTVEINEHEVKKLVDKLEWAGISDKVGNNYYKLKQVSEKNYR